MPGPGPVAASSGPLVVATNCVTSDAGSGYVTPPSTSGRGAATEAATGSAHWDARRDGTAVGGGSDDGGSDGGKRGGSQRQRPPSASTETSGSKAAQAVKPAKPTETEKVRNGGGGGGGGGGAWQWMNNAGKRASGKLSRARRGVSGVGRRGSPDPAKGDTGKGDETRSLIGTGSDRISDFIGREAGQSRTPVEQRGKAFTTPITDADQLALSDCSSSEELAEVGRSEMLAWATVASVAGRSGAGDGARPRPPPRRKGRYRRTSSSGSSREPRLVAAPRSTTGSGPGSGSTLETDVLPGAEARRQAFGADEGGGGGGGDRNGEFQAASSEGYLEPALGKPATTMSASTSGPAAAWSWKTLAMAKTSTASTSATSINSAALGPSCSPRSEVHATGSAGSGTNGGRGGSSKGATVGVMAGTAGCSVSSTSTPSAPAPAPAPAPAEGASGAAPTAKMNGRDSSGLATGAPIASVASGAGGRTASADEKSSFDSGRSANAAPPPPPPAADGASAAVRVQGAPSSRPPPFPTSSTTRLRAKVRNPGGDGADAVGDDHANAQRYPMDSSSPSDSGGGRTLFDGSGGEGGRGRTGKERRRQAEAMSTQQRASATVDRSSESAVTIEVDVDGSPNAGDFNCLDSAGGGSFEIQVFGNGGSADAPTPSASTADNANENDCTNAGSSKDDEGSDSLDSGFGSAASPEESIGGMTEGEIVAAAEAAMSSAKKAAAGAAPGGEHTPRSRLLLATAAIPFLHPAAPAPATPGNEGERAGGGVSPARGGGISSGSALEQGAARDLGGEGALQLWSRRALGRPRGVLWWREGAAKALAASADNKKTPARSRSGTPGRSRGAVAPRPAGAAGATATSRGPKGTPSTRGGSRRGDRAGGGGGAGGGEGGGGGAASSVLGGYLTPSGAAAATEVSPTCSTISSREQAERDRERLAAVAGNRGYRRSSWGVALPSAGNGDSNSAITGTPGGYGTDEGYSNAAGARSSRRGSRASYHSADSSGWGLTSDEGGDGESQSRRWRPSLTSSVTSGGGDGSGTGSSGAGPTPSSSAYGSGASAAASVFSDDEGSSSSRSSISTGYESSVKGDDRGAADRRGDDAPPPSPPGDDAQPREEDGSSPRRDNYPPPSPAGSPQTPVSAQSGASSMNKLEKSALKKKAHYEKQANAAAGAAIAAAALAAAAGATAAARRQSSQSFSERSQGGSPRGNAGRSGTGVTGGREPRRGRMPSETRAILSRGGSLPAFDVFHPRATAAERGHARHGSSGDVVGGGKAGKPVGTLSAWPTGQATSSKQAPLSRRVQSTVSEGSRPRHASVEEAIAMAVAWTPSQIQRGAGGNSSHYSQSKQGGRGGKEDRGGSVGQQPGDGRVGAEGERVSGSGGRARDSQYFFSSRASSVRGMSPAGIVQDHQERHRNPSPAELRRAKSSSNREDSTDEARNGRSGDGTRGQRRRSRRPLPTPPTPQDRKEQQQEQQRRRRAKRREGVASSSGGRKDREPLTIPPLPKVLFRPPVAGTPRHRNHNQPHQRKNQKQQQQQQQRQQDQERPSGARRKGIALGDAAGGGSGSGRGTERGEGGGGGGGGRGGRGGGGGGYFRSDPSRSIGDWPSFAGTPTSTSFSPSSAVANPFIATRYTQRSSLSARSNSTSQRGGGGSGPLRSAGSESRVSPSSPIGRAHVRAQPRAARAGEQTGGHSRGNIHDETRGGGGGGGDYDSAVASSPPRGGQSGRASSNYRRTSSDRNSGRKYRGGDGGGAAAAAAAVDSGSVSDLGVDLGARNAGGSSSRPIFRTMSLRGRSLFSGGPGIAERRSVSMSSFRGRGDSMRADGDYDSVHSWRGGRRGVANRVCSALSVGWLFSRNSGKPKGKDKQKKTKKKRKNGGPLGGVLDLSRTSSRRSPYSSAGVVGVMDNGQDGYTSSDEDDGDDIFEIGGPRDIAVGGGGVPTERQVRASGGGGGVERTTGERGGVGGKTASEGGNHDTTAAAPAAGGNEDARNRLSFTRSGMLGLDRSTNSSMSSYSFVQHAPSRGAGSATASNNSGARAKAADPTPGADGGGGRQVDKSADPSAGLTVDGSGGGAIQASGNAGRTPAASDRTDGVQYVNFNGHGGRGGGVVALRGAGVATIKTQGDPSVAGVGFSSMVESERRPEVDEEEAKRRMDTLLLRSRVHTHLNPTGAPGAGAPAH